MKWLLPLLLIGAAHAVNVGSNAEYSGEVVMNAEWAAEFSTRNNPYQQGRIELTDDHLRAWPVMWISTEPGGRAVGEYCTDTGSATRIKWELRNTYERRCVLDINSTYYLNVRYDYRPTRKPYPNITIWGNDCGGDCRFRIRTVLEAWQWW